MSKLRVFLVHGHDSRAVAAIRSLVVRANADVDTFAFEDVAILGDTIPETLERILLQGDAAIVLATPDDIGGLKGTIPTQPRARENVWLELGWFWARLGRRRTLLLLKGDTETPSDLSGVLYLHFRRSVREIEAGLGRFIDGIRTAEPDRVTEIVWVARDAGQRSAEYRQVVSSAESRAVISGIGMMNVRQQLPDLVARMIQSPNFDVDFLVPAPDFLDTNEDIASTAYRPNLADDVRAFVRDATELVRSTPSVQGRFRVHAYEEFVSYVATVADPGEFGSLALVDVLLPVGRHHLVDRPRMMLRRRCSGGLYDRYWAALSGLRSRATRML